MSFMGSGFSAINIGDEIIEINNQVVVCKIKFKKIIFNFVWRLVGIQNILMIFFVHHHVLMKYVY